jgi:predicted amidohydrolase
MGMMICNDRRWPEAWRVLGLQGVELVCVGYNSALTIQTAVSPKTRRCAPSIPSS